MGQVLHANAKTTAKVRREIQNSKESIAKLAKRYDINPKTAAKWKNRTTVEDSPMGPKKIKSTVLTEEEEAVIVAFRRHTLLPLDDCLYALQETIPNLSRSSLHRCLQRNGISKLPKSEEESGNKKTKSKFEAYPIGYFHIDIAEVATSQGKLYLFVAIDRVCKYTYVELHTKNTQAIAASFLKNLHGIVPYKIHTILTDNGIQFTNRINAKQAPLCAFSQYCEDNGIKHKLTKINHPWTNGQVERMNRTIKEATVKNYHYDTHEQLVAHLKSFMNAYNFAKRLKTLKGLTPFEEIRKWWKKSPEYFIVEPDQFNLGLNT